MKQTPGGRVGVSWWEGNKIGFQGHRVMAAQSWKTARWPAAQTLCMWPAGRWACSGAAEHGESGKGAWLWSWGPLRTFQPGISYSPLSTPGYVSCGVSSLLPPAPQPPVTPVLYQDRNNRLGQALDLDPGGGVSLSHCWGVMAHLCVSWLDHKYPGIWLNIISGSVYKGVSRWD